jgi:serine/threonine protein kinase
MAPEQCRGAAHVDAKADVYALGVMLYELFAGRRPFISDLPSEIMTLQVRSAPPPIKELVPDLPEDLVALIHRMLSKRPATRPTMCQVAERLQPWVDAAPTWLRGSPGRALPANTQTVSSLPAEKGISIQSLHDRRASIVPFSAHPRAVITVMMLLVVAALGSGVIALQQWQLATAARRGARSELAASASPALGSAAAAARPTEQQKSVTIPALAARRESPALAVPPRSAVAPSPVVGKTTAPSVRTRGDDLMVPLFKEKRSHDR